MSGVKPRQCFTYVFSGGHTNPFPFSVCGCGGGSAGALDAALASIVNLVIVVYTPVRLWVVSLSQMQAYRWLSGSVKTEE
jgi:hypothetical protein